MTERRWLVWADETPQVPNRQLTLNEAIVAFRDYVEDDTEEKVEIRQVDPQDLIPLDAASTPDTAADDQDADLPYYEAVRDLLIGKLHNPVSAERIAGWLADAKMLRRRELEVTSTPNTELRERYARAIARAMWGAAVNRCDPMPIDWSAADAVMAERDTENARLNGKLGEALGEAQRLREQLAEREKLPRVWQEGGSEPDGVRMVTDRSGYRRWCRSTADGTWYMRDIAGPVLTWRDLVELNGPVTEVRAALTERQRE